MMPYKRYLCLIAIVAVGLLVQACDPSDATALGSTPSGPTPDSAPISAEIQEAIARGDLTALAPSDLPSIPNLDAFIKDHDAAIALGKAFFWDMQVGNSGQACASCHFHAGVDRRIKNSLHPGNRDVAVFEGDDSLLMTGEVFQSTQSGGMGGPNAVLQEADFPFHRKADPADRDSMVVFDTDDLVGSQGVLNATFGGTGLDGIEDCQPVGDGLFNVGGGGAPDTRTRRVTPRHTPTMINAALNHRNFWDGRANHVFNGVNPFGRRDPSARVWHVATPGATPEQVAIRIENSSLASQAVGPPLSASEMSCGAAGSNRVFAHIGRKLIQQMALANQAVHPEDSVLAAYRAGSGPGLDRTYETFIQAAFDEQWWQSPLDWTTCGENTAPSSAPDCFTLMEANFSMFWGLAIQAYERTLLSNETRFDTFVREIEQGGTSTALNEAEINGLHVFVTEGQCLACHRGAALTTASVAAVQDGGQVITRRETADASLGAALQDEGFFNIGVRPPNDGDSGLGLRQHPEAGIPLSFAAQYVEGIADRDFAPDADGEGGRQLLPDACAFDTPLTVADLPSVTMTCPGEATAVHPDFDSDDLSGLRVAVNGAFKTPGLRNIALTGPYMHNGGMSTLEQVIEFYNRGGNFVSDDLANSIQPLDLTQPQQDNLVAFLNALTDERVSHERAPFDHPELVIAHGHGGDETVLDCLTAVQVSDVDPLMLMDGCDNMEVLPAIGSSGTTLPTILPFIEILRQGFMSSR